MSISTPIPAVAPDPSIDFLGLFADQTEDVILNRMRDWANEGLDPVANADVWTDTREGSHWFMAVMPGVRELARLYDFLGTDIVMSAFVLWAWGTYLDDLAAVYDVDRKAATYATGLVTFAGPAGEDISLGTTVGVVPQSPDDPAPTFGVVQEGTIPDAGAGSGSISLPIAASHAGAAGNVGPNAITAPSTPLPAGVTVTNTAATSGGADPETDEELRKRVLEAILGQGGANVAAYVKWATAWPGVGLAKVVPAWAGPNSVLVVVDDENGQPVPSSVASALQADLDPVAGKGEGTAPVGAQVTVDTSTVLNIDVTVGAITYHVGYSADGAGNTIAVQNDIAQAISDYFLTVLPGDAVALSVVAGIIATWEGVKDATGVQLNGAAANVPVALSPPQSPTLRTLTL